MLRKPNCSSAALVEAANAPYARRRTAVLGRGIEVLPDLVNARRRLAILRMEANCQAETWDLESGLPARSK